jgi:hypothetical protein
MGRTYLFECPKCGYRSRVSGGGDHGFHFAVQTIVCLDCKELYDAVTELKIVVEPPAVLNTGTALLRREKPVGTRKKIVTPPAFQSALNRLLLTGAKQFRWLSFDAACLISPRHRVQKWNWPGKCPKCGLFLEQSAIPFRIWD